MLQDLKNQYESKEKTKIIEEMLQGMLKSMEESMKLEAKEGEEL